ncbi:MAG: hypothetical protein SGCHY_001605 [Lobulomycetales sp.]
MAEALSPYPKEEEEEEHSDSLPPPLLPSDPNAVQEPPHAPEAPAHDGLAGTSSPPPAEDTHPPSGTPLTPGSDIPQTPGSDIPQTPDIPQVHAPTVLQPGNSIQGAAPSIPQLSVPPLHNPDTGSRVQPIDFNSESLRHPISIFIIVALFCMLACPAGLVVRKVWKQKS